MRMINFLVLLVACFVFTSCSFIPSPTQVATIPAGVTAPFPTITETSLPVVPTETNIPKAELVLPKGPYIVFGESPDGVIILWQSEEREVFTFDFGVDETYSLGIVTVEPDLDTGLYSLTINGLEQGKRYLYRLATGLGEIHGSFITSSAKDSSLVFWAYGDTREGPGTYDKLSRNILSQVALEPSTQTFTISTGDLMNVASEESLQENVFAPEFKSIRELMRNLPVVNINGNHDGTALFKKYFPYPFSAYNDWSFDYGPAHFVVINQYLEFSEGSERWYWLQEDLAGTSQPWKFILLHEPGWAAGPHENNLTVQEVLHPLAVENGVSMFISGHNHYYSRATVDGVVHLTTGGGGAPLYDPGSGWPWVEKTIKTFHYVKLSITGDVLTVQALSPNGVVLDEFSIKRLE